MGGTTQVDVNTERYEFSTGKKPRGFGGWAFQVGDQVVFLTDLYSEVRKTAIAQARSNGVAKVIVLP